MDSLEYHSRSVAMIWCRSDRWAMEIEERPLAPRRRADCLLQPKLAGLDSQNMSPFVAVKHFFHLGDIIKVPHDVSRSEVVAGLYIFPVQFLDEADITALMAPRLRYLGRVQSHARQPRSWLARDLDLVGSNHPFRNLVVFSLIKVLGIGPKILGKHSGRNEAVIT